MWVSGYTKFLYSADLPGVVFVIKRTKVGMRQLASFRRSTHLASWPAGKKFPYVIQIEIEVFLMIL